MNKKNTLLKIVNFIKKVYHKERPIPLHRPLFIGNEKKYLNECIDSTFVSSVGSFVTKLETIMKEYTGSTHAVAVTNGTCALHLALLVLGIQKDDEVMLPTITFVGTANSIRHSGAHPLFVGSQKETLGLCPDTLRAFLQNDTYTKNGKTYNKTTKRHIAACIVVHIFGHPAPIDFIKDICTQYNIALIEDAAEAMGSTYQGKHLSTYGDIGIYSFNGNKIITAGGGGMLITNDKNLATRAKHISTTAKVPHKQEFIHDMVGYNYRMPNINAALAVAQMENLELFIKNKRALARRYQDFFNSIDIPVITEAKGARSNYWLNAIIFDSPEEKQAFLQLALEHGVGARPLWTPLHKLAMYNGCQTTALSNSQWLYERLVCLPSSVTI